MTRSAVPMEQAVQAIRPTDTLAVPLGPGVLGAFLHALGERTDFVDLRVSGALLPDLFALFMQPTVHLQSGFFGPAERFLRDSGADIDFVDNSFSYFTGNEANIISGTQTAFYSENPPIELKNGSAYYLIKTSNSTFNNPKSWFVKYDSCLFCKSTNTHSYIYRAYFSKQNRIFTTFINYNG